MPIQEQNIKIAKSSVMLDVPEGGGPPSASYVVDGVSNQIFDDISEVARAGGNVSVRKVHTVVNTSDTSVFLGANVIVAEPPEDPRVGVSLFSTKSTFDTREEAAKRIESYLFAGPVWNGYLFENHITGQRTVQYFQYPNSALPKAGTTMYLVQNEELPTEYGQYIRALEVSFEERTFINEDDGKPYQAWIVSCELSDPLLYDFPGSPPSPKFKRKDGKTLTRETRVTDAAKYYGVSKLQSAAVMGDTKVRAASIYTPIVPSAQTEIPLVNKTLQDVASPMVQSSIVTQTTSFWHVHGAEVLPVKRYLPMGCKQSTFSMAGNQAYVDDGTGRIVGPLDEQVGTIDYSTGECIFTVDAWNGTPATVTYKPATAVAQQTFTLFRNVTQETRRFNWIETLKPKPAPGTLSFAYMALGNWYVLRDNGKGELRGDDSSYGAGTISYITGTMAVTTGVLPDADTGIFLVWATEGLYQMTDSFSATPPNWKFTIPVGDGYTVEKGSVSIQWTVLGVTKTITDADTPGLLLGTAGHGAIRYYKGDLTFLMEKLPDPASTPLVTYSRSLLHTQTFTPTTDGNGFINITLPNTPIKPRSLSIEWETIRTKTFSEKSNNSIGGVAYYNASEDYNSSTATSRSWMSSFSNGWSGQWIVHDYSAAMSLSVKNSISQSASFTKRVERTQDGSDSNVVVSKTAFDYQPNPAVDSGEIFGTQKGSIDYNTGALRFKPTEVAKTSSWGLTSGGSFATDQSQSNSVEGSSSWAGSTNYQEWYQGGNGSAGVTTTSGTTKTSSSGGSSNAEGGSFGSETFSDTWGDGSAVKVSWVEASITPQAQTATLPAQKLVFDLSPFTAQQVVPKSVMFKLGTATYVDRDGVLYMNINPLTGSGIEAGSINYGTGTITVDTWVAGDAPTFEVLSCLTRHGNVFTSSVAFRTAAAPLKSSSVQVIATTVDGEQQIGTSNLDGWILHTDMIGKVNYRNGIVQVAFGSFGPQPDFVAPPENPTATAPMVWIAAPMEASTIRYNAVAYSYLPLDAEILGLNPVRLPSDGMVPMFRKGEFAVVGNTQTTASMTVTVGQVVNLGRTRLSRIRVLHDFSVSNPHGTPIGVGYSVNLNSGVVTFNDPGTYIQPIKIEHRIEDMAMVSDVQINGFLTFTRPVTHDYPAETSYVSAAIVAGDLRARVSAVFDQETWTSDQWDDIRVGAGASASFNNSIFPILVTNAGAVTERWVLRFLTTTSFEVIGEHVGNIFTGNTNPVGSETHLNIPNAAVPGQFYMSLPYLGFGSGWSAGNILRINTVGAQFPLWVIRTVQQGPETAVDDTFSLLVRGDVDTVI